MNNNPLFSPIKLGKLELANRIAMAPMTRSFSTGNVPNDLVVEYYRRRAAGGVGLIITEGTCVGHKAASGYPDVPMIAGDKALTGWKKVVDAVHAEGGKIAPQLWHVGAIRQPGIEPGGDTPGYGPSGMAMPGKVTGHTMTQQDIDEIVAAFAQAAKDAKAIGFDAVEIHGAHGYLIDQFFWPETNQRDDAYGGDLAARSRFAIEVIKATRAAVGEDFPIIFRWSQWKQQDYTARLVETPEELKAFLTPLVDAGVDIFHCSTRRFWEPEFADSSLNLAGWSKKVSGVPTITVGSVGLDADFLPIDGSLQFRSAAPASLDNITERLINNEFDLVAVGRALIANPEWANQVQDGLTDSLRPYSEACLKELV
ncbi:2,4-dienoyl-CoA reductase-like NADH-dependent reductase (Old Yellow Enzyme family) [Sinobacterium caligoides]|uniref:2,4-dienoyl-CoA reductase-like NADH-dependent reductase (Old Yellow Enzyme family) n=1 Tax=Sinobacterium caligoides TaxID=933926 RepID=A0A3N2DZZ9_9GAMM|nr:NADH:flavin oxidoreductase [Sinobacterium caligoides]ROS05357.1 2,4-dienoyl-CoA reductase-like NADH-dependent reductase (Old Yellow Enzyme family) [Sinobacterium caligoides]